MTEITQHPLSAAFPAMASASYAELRADIAANGLRSRIMILDNQVLDGWHRYRACVETGVEPRFNVFEGDELAARLFVVSANLMRRHLNGTQRGMIAAEFATRSVGRPGKGAPVPDSIAQAAETLNVSERTVRDARAVLASGDAETIAKARNGEISAKKAAIEIRAKTPKATKLKPVPLFSGPLPPPIVIQPVTVEEWANLPPDHRAAYLAHRNPDAKLNHQKDTEDDNLIDWAKWTWNPITGCQHNCPYCYARDIADRFAGTSPFPNGFIPTFRADRLSAPLNYRPRESDDPRDRRIFTGSMTDLFGRWVPREWINTVLDVADTCHSWEFLMLTKFPKRMSEFSIPNNVWMGTSVDCQARVDNAEAAFEHVEAKVRWLSCEPMLEPLKFRRLDLFDLIVIGGASPSSQTPRWIPPFAWLDDLMRQANDANCAVYLKSNLYLKEQPGGSRYIFKDQAPKVFRYLKADRAAAA
jgi:protein gp37